MRKITSGFSVILGMPGIKLSSRPATTSTMGYGVCSLRARTANSTTNPNSSRNTTSTP